jgi:hypothetical protein
MPIGTTSPFRPTGTVALAASANSANTVLAGGGDTVVVTNPTTALAYVRFGADPSVAASSADMPVLPNSRIILAVNSLIAYAAGILAGGNGTLLFTRGDGTFL